MKQFIGLFFLPIISKSFRGSILKCEKSNDWLIFPLKMNLTNQKHKMKYNRKNGRTNTLKPFSSFKT